MGAPESQLVRGVRKLLPYTSAAALVALFYVSWVFFSRWNENRQLERAAGIERARTDKEITEKLGAGRLTILSFYASPPVIARGGKTLLCYGVANAKVVRLEPAVERVWPSVSRCFDVAPNRETRYTLTAEDATGHSVAESITISVK
jgi:hypothetical protein